MKQLWCNGRWLDSQDFPGTPEDRGSLHGLGLFETMLALDGTPVFASQHLARLRKALEQLGWEIALPNLRSVATELLQRNQLSSGRARIRLTISAGSGPINDLSLGADHLVWITAFLNIQAHESRSICLSPWPRNERSPLAGLKCASYAENLIALDHARRGGFDETIFLNTAGQLCEAALANLFLVKNQVLQTPSLASGCLPGVTRQMILELADRHQLACEERILHWPDLLAADEIFLTSSTRGPMGVTRCDEVNFLVGPLTSKIQLLWNAAVELDAQQTAI